MRNTVSSSVGKRLSTWYAPHSSNPCRRANVPIVSRVTPPGHGHRYSGIVSHARLSFPTDRCSQVAVNRTQPNGRVLGVDIIPAQPPKGVSTIQGNFLAPEIQEYIQEFLRNPSRGRPRQPDAHGDVNPSLLEPRLATDPTSSSNDPNPGPVQEQKILERTVDVVLSDMSAPWFQTSGFWKRSLSDPYNRMMNTSGNNFRDHIGSMVRALNKPG